MTKPSFQLLAACAVIFSIALPAGAAGRDWKAFPAIVTLDTSHDIYAVGDFHGDYDKAVALLAGAGLIRGVPARPQDTQWAGGKAVLVCTGDMIDKWKQSIEVIQMMRALQAGAASKGGRVIVTFGNHEAEFLAASGSNHKAAEFEQELREQNIDPLAVAEGRDTGGMGSWLRNLPVGAKVDDWFFCHAGNTGGKSIPQLEKEIESGVDQNSFGAPILSQPNSILEARMHPVPWWLDAEADKEKHHDKGESNGAARLAEYARALGCSHIVMGHQPDKVTFAAKDERPAGEAFAYEGVLFLIDTGLSRGVANGRGVVLKIHDGEKESVHTIDETGENKILWSAK